MLSAMQAYTAKNYTDPNDPYFSGHYAVGNLYPIARLTVVSYNIWFAEDIDQAILELREIGSQKELDILLLQEMDEVSTERIAHELQLNYVYFPAAVEPTYDKNFGNAILSRWPIVDAQKLVLPHKSLSNRMNRTATKATVKIYDAEVLVYSIHTESNFTLPQFREDQFTTVLEDISAQAGLVIVGGDFNTFTEADVSKIEAVYQQAGLMRASEACGYTLVKSGIKVSSDHIFTRGFLIDETGKLTSATASDHLPIWVTLTFK